MPHYDFFCHACQKTFSKILTIAEHGKEKIKCPHCGSKWENVSNVVLPVSTW